MDSQRRKLIRVLSGRLNNLHSQSYFSAPVAEALAAIGLTSGAEQYYASRAAAMGEVPASVVTATFYNFSPAHAAQHVPAAWDKASAAMTLTARLVGVAELNRQTFAEHPDARALEDSARQVVDGIQPVLEAMRADGRPLFAAHGQALATRTPESVFDQLWDVATLVREYRGDSHIAALVTTGVSGLDSVVLHTATGTSFWPRVARKTRGYSEDEWQQAQDRLLTAGLVAPQDHDRLPVRITEAGKELREGLEALTDDAVAESWAPLGDQELSSLISATQPLAQVVADSGAFSPKLFAH